MSTKKPSGLGKGLTALFGEDTLASAKINSTAGFIPDLPIDDIIPNPNQPRVYISPEELITLADSIREHGIIEPLIVTRIDSAADARTGEKVIEAAKKQFLQQSTLPSEQTAAEVYSPGIAGKKYQLVAGERRWRAAKLAKLKTVPVLIKDITSQQVLELAIIENIQRQDLNPLEEALAITELHKTYNLKLEVLSKRIGRDVSTLSNKMRLLKLPTLIQTALLTREISESHAYQLLSLKSTDAMLAAYNIVKKQKLSVNQTEELVRKILHANREVLQKKPKGNSVVYDDFTIKVTQDLTNKLGKGVKLLRKKQGGSLTIPFHSDSELEAIYKYLMK